jgi:predicted  nucleic acid-binding Zn-ribbon protein
VQEQLQERLAQLKEEFDKGQRRLAQIEVDALELRQTLLRISGAIQVIEEELAKAQHPGVDASGRWQSIA